MAKVSPPSSVTHTVACELALRRTGAGLGGAAALVAPGAGGIGGGSPGLRSLVCLLSEERNLSEVPHGGPARVKSGNSGNGAQPWPDSRLVRRHVGLGSDTYQL